MSESNKNGIENEILESLRKFLEKEVKSPVDVRFEKYVNKKAGNVFIFTVFDPPQVSDCWFNPEDYSFGLRGIEMEYGAIIKVKQTIMIGDELVA